MTNYDFNYDFNQKRKNTEALGLADLGTRLVALIIDSVILGIVGSIFFVSSRHGGSWAVTFIVGIAYQWFFLTRNNGQTIGKSVMGIRVVKADGSPLTTTDAFLRYIGYYVNSFLFSLGWLWAVVDSNKQGFHDKLVNTYVVRVR